MKCAKCSKDFPENELELSHDIPKYMGGVDIDGRHYLCHDCHEDYDNLIIKRCLEFVGEEFVEEERIQWMIELKQQSALLKSKFMWIAFEVKEEFYGRH